MVNKSEPFKMGASKEMRSFVILLNYGLLCCGQFMPEDYYYDIVTRDPDDLMREKENEVRALRAFQADCAEDVQVKPDLVVNLKSGDWQTEDVSLKKWALCVLMKLGLMTAQGVFKMNEAMSKIPDMNDKIIAEKLIDDCLSLQATTPHDAAWNYIKCHHQKDPEGNFSSLNIF
ncbi:uncharacterized protein LOC101744692 [Bombyx mori]|uniref:Uncharacterized protein n=2 Tax=Bombyx TaxID=7090 RepID=A0A8R2ANL5_BOMMO|nr:uncharacterized protein LOC101744692 isoform X2 [Bombyx mori]